MAKSIVWLSIESLRYDHSFSSNQTDGFGPSLQAIANRSDAKSFSQCFSHGNWTRTSTTSILSGMYPSSHGVFHWTDKLSSDVETVPEILSEYGYHSILIGKNSQIGSAIDAGERFDETIQINRDNIYNSVGVSGLLGYLMRLRSHSSGFTTDLSRHKSSYLTNYAIKKRVKSKMDPAFIFVHYNDTHNPYIPPLPYLKEVAESLPVEADEAVEMAKDIFDKDGRKYHILGRANDELTDTEFKIITAFYNASIAYVEEMVVSAIDYFTSELDAIVVVSGDHGELFGEQELISHGISTHNAVTHVPLLIQGDTDLHEYNGQIQHIDIMKTLLKEQGIEHSQLQGFDLRDQQRRYSIAERGVERSNVIFQRIEEAQGKEVATEYPRGDLIDIQTDRFKFIKGDGYEELFELPDESTDVKKEYPDMLDEFRSEYADYINTYQSGRIASEKSSPSEKTKQRLENMGYIVD